jgi:hypothetical protein
MQIKYCSRGVYLEQSTWKLCGNGDTPEEMLNIPFEFGAWNFFAATYNDLTSKLIRERQSLRGQELHFIRKPWQHNFGATSRIKFL